MIRLAVEVSWSEPRVSTACVQRMLETRPDLVSDGRGGATAAHVAMATGVRHVRQLEVPNAGLLARPSGLLVAVDARLDNRDELSRELFPEERRPITEVELIAAGHERWGLELPHHLDGDFAYVIWEPEPARLVAVRDRLGVRPLFFAEHGRSLLIASDVAQLLAVPAIPRTPDLDSLLDFVTWNARTLDSSMFRAIRRLGPGHQLVATSTGTRTCRYWTVLDDTGAPPPRDAEEAFAHELRRSVEQRLESGFSVLVPLSGGLDSSAIALFSDAALARRAPSPPVIAASAVYPGLPCDESAVIRSISARFTNVQHVTWDGRTTDPTVFENPCLAWPGERLQYPGGSTGDLAIARSTDARVLLAGTGGDEICWDGMVLHELAARHRWAAVVHETMLEHAPWRRRVGRLLRAALGSAPAVRRAVLRLRARPAARPHWLAPDLGSRWDARAEGDLAAASNPHPTPVEQIARDLSSPEFLKELEASQCYSAISGAETRFPMLSRSMIRLMLSLELEQRRPRGRSRGFQRRALSGLLPREVLTGPKVFYPAASHLLAKTAARRLRALLDRSPWLSENVVTRRGATEMVQQFEERRLPWHMCHLVTRMALLEGWLREVSAR